MIREIPRRFQYKSIFPRISWQYCELCEEEGYCDYMGYVDYIFPKED